jgi:sugar phosphate isomerase/epimerase/bacterioferritin (cytochrome b1)
MADNYVINEYQGGASSFEPTYGNIFTGYTTSAGSIGMATDARTANVLKEVSTKLAMGVQNIELSQVDAATFQMIPKGHLKEVNRLAKLTGTEITLHAPVVEPSGMGQQGFDETQRQATERSMNLAIERANELNPDGSSPVTFHSSAAIPGTEWQKIGEKATKLIAVEQETGKVIPINEESKHYPRSWEAKHLETMSPEEGLDSINNTQWTNSISQLVHAKEMADRIIVDNQPKIQHLLGELGQPGGKKLNELLPAQQETYSHYLNAEAYLKDASLSLSGMFNKAYKYGSDQEKKFLTEMSKEYKKDLGILDPSKKHSQEAITEARMKQGDLQTKSHAINTMIRVLQNTSPELYVPVEEFAKDKSSETFANVALESFKKFGDKAPIISIENPPAGGALSTGEDLKNLVVETRKKFVEKAQENMNLSKRQAEKEAEKLIGVTWDVGHINMLRKQGLGSKEIIEESKKVAPFVKHVHLSDNFGLEHTELPMGMGNVPLKEIMQHIEKEGFEGKKVVEALHWWQHFQSPPFVSTLEAVGSYMYAGSGPTWNQAIGLQQGYSSGFGGMLPDINYQTFGAGFSQLPTELGGQRQGGQGNRMSGRGME